MADHVLDSELTVDSLAKKAFLRPEQRQDLRRSIAAAEERLANPIILEMTGGDPESLRKQVVREQEMLENGAPPKLSSGQLAKVHRLEAHLREKITYALPTFTMMERARPTDIDHHVAWERENKQRVLAWKSCLQMLDPDNTEPNFLSIARLRSDTVKGDPRKYTNNFDAIKWAEVIEEDLVRDMDDSTYHRFLEYKVIGWSRPSICKEMAWTDKMYEAAMERLRQAMHGAQNHGDQDEDTGMTWGEEDAEDDTERPSPDAKETGRQDIEETETATVHALSKSEQAGTIFDERNNFHKKPRESRPPHWLEDSLRKRNVSMYRFMKEHIKRTDSQAIRNMDISGEWIAPTLEKIEEALARIPQHNERPKEVLG